MFCKKIFSPLIVTMTIVGCLPRAQAQIIYTKYFTERLVDAHLDYYKPLEQWFHVSEKRDDRFSKYDLVLINEDEDLEFRYIFKEYQDDELDQFPDVNRMRMIHHISTNDQEEDIRVRTLEQKDVRERFNADFGSIHYFKPKNEYSMMPFGAMITLYAKGKSTIFAIILYQDGEFEPIDHFHQIRFRD